ncbi:dihydrolipoyl dehydrogenase [Miniphocaeibacter massiliensis]|uniref:dihydrolipoyl dehydrogenase n=1 Tax=Miniphocaeibacter massiliensis TaxID=2041841 RepID=UPI000C08328B|nr:dihydrolipoyl dehydrogenase [Miniphocaeibacter massiliensis]
MPKIVVIGAGPGGYETAIRAAQLGAEVVLIEKGRAGGTCLNIGCIPTKTLWKTAELFEQVKESTSFGIKLENPSVDMAAVKARKDYVADRMNTGVNFLVDSYPNIEYIEGYASFKDENTIIVDKGEEKVEVAGDYFIIATGSAPLVPSFEGSRLENVITSTELLDLDYLPEKLVVVGTGVIGMEFASIYNSFGTDVTVIGSDILGACESEITKRIQSIFKQKGMKIEKGYRASKIEKSANGLTVFAENKKGKVVEAEGDLVLLAIGRIPFTEGLNLEGIGIETNRGGVVVDKDLKTSKDNIFAIGDCISGNVQLAHVASNQGLNLVERLMGNTPHIVEDVVPAATFTLPEIAQVGKTEDQLKEEGIEYDKSKFLFSGNGKAVSMGETDGFVKILASKDHKKILGVHIFGPHANDIVHLGAVAMANDLPVSALNKTIFAHPTLSETFMEASHGLEGASIHTAKVAKK